MTVASQIFGFGPGEFEFALLPCGFDVAVASLAGMELGGWAVDVCG